MLQGTDTIEHMYNQHFAMHHAWSAVNIRDHKDRCDSSVEKSS